ncbi:hypothetical protein N0V83_000802 [Neocucurbitaria cava]|uniref:Uncharacterized protein n=1 Tax=Neocucurbitaria cava TaxID=798079 RepID=A0A9W8YKI7_9PLEO|nr:hypothetical protein N0V83_000802 [Neocucurbitaria cava]
MSDVVFVPRVLPAKPSMRSVPRTPRQGSIVIDMTERVVKPRGRKKKEDTRNPDASETATPESSTSARSARPKPPKNVLALAIPEQKSSSTNEQGYPEDVERAITAVRYQYQPPTFHQPSRALPDAFDAAFISHYVELNKSKRTYAPEIQWLVHLPRIHSNANRPAVRLSLRALSMAFYGKLHQDRDILVDSWRWYSVSLNAQRQSISRLSRKRNGIPDEEEVLVPLILALYEVNVGATTSGSMAHSAAAAEIMQMRGPKIQGTLRVFFETPVPAHVDNGPARQLTSKLLADLDRWATTYPNLTGNARGDAPVTAASGTGLSVTNEDLKDQGLPDTFIALIRSNYLAMRLVLNMIMHKMETQSTTPPATPDSAAPQYLTVAIQSAQAILKAAEEVEKRKTPGFDLLRSISPVLAVICTAPTRELGNSASEMLQRWGTRIGGLASVFTRI